jgi:hypothetical protein
MNIYVQNNFAAGIPDIFTAKGQIFAATGVDAGAVVNVGANGFVYMVDHAEATGIIPITIARMSAAPTSSSINYLIRANWYSLRWPHSERYDTTGSLAYVDSPISLKYTAPYSGYYFVTLSMVAYGDGTGDGAPVPYYLLVGINKNTVLQSVLGGAQMTGDLSASYFAGGQDILYFAKGDIIEPVFYIKTNWNNAFSRAGQAYYGDSKVTEFTITPIH